MDHEAGLTYEEKKSNKHYKEQNEWVAAIAERIQILGGISRAMAADVAEWFVSEHLVDSPLLRADGAAE